MARGRAYENVSQMIGETPMVRINQLISPEHTTVYAKCEFFQPLNSVKDRIGVAMRARRGIACRTRGPRRPAWQ